MPPENPYAAPRTLDGRERARGTLPGGLKLAELDKEQLLQLSHCASWINLSLILLLFLSFYFGFMVIGWPIAIYCKIRGYAAWPALRQDVWLFLLGRVSCGFAVVGYSLSLPTWITNVVLSTINYTIWRTYFSYLIFVVPIIFLFGAAMTELWFWLRIFRSTQSVLSLRNSLILLFGLGVIFWVGIMFMVLNNRAVDYWHVGVGIALFVAMLTVLSMLATLIILGYIRSELTRRLAAPTDTVMNLNQLQIPDPRDKTAQQKPDFPTE